MQLTSLCGLSHRPCVLLQWPSLTVMVDCGLDMRALLHFLPAPLVPSARLTNLPGGVGLKECQERMFIDDQPHVSIPQLNSVAVEQIDAVLVSNYLGMLALPYLMEKPGFRAIVLATDPTTQLGRLIMEELVEFSERVSAQSTSTAWKEKQILSKQGINISSDLSCWRTIYNLESVKNAVSAVQLIAYRETVDIYGLGKISAYSSGHSLGSCNWNIKTDTQKISYISCSSVLSAHPKAFNMSPLKNADALILTGLTQVPSIPPETALLEFCSHVVQTVANGGNALIPCWPTGTLYDLIECLVAHLDKAAVSPDLPIYLISPVADSTLAYANIFAEWLSEQKQNKVYEPKEPFDHGELLRGGRLKAYPNIYKDFSREFRTPCVVFVGNPSLRFGDVVHFMEIWGQDPNSAVVITDPDLPMHDLLAPYQPLAMKTFFCPIDTRLDYGQTAKLLKELTPNKLILPQDYCRNEDEFSVQYSHLLPFTCGQSINLEERQRYRKVKLDPELGANLEFSNDISACSLMGYLSAYDNNLILKPHSSEKENMKEKPRPLYYGLMRCEQVVKTLKSKEIEMQLEKQNDLNFRLKLPTLKATVSVTNGTQTTVTMNPDADGISRKIVRDLLCQCLQAL